VVKRRLFAALAVLALGIGLGAYVWLRPSEERRVEHRVRQLTERISREPDEGNSTMALKANALGGMFADQVQVDLQQFPANGTHSGAELVSHIARARPLYRAIRLRAHDIRVTLESPEQATARFTARLTLERADGAVAEDTREIRARLVRDPERTWRFAAFTERPVMTR
jgi:hypothetical protein